jgi:uncharacterized ion transporter superfamily protein YfcC
VKRFPDSLVLIFAMVVLAQLATYVLPSGRFERATTPTALDAPLVVEVGAPMEVPQGTVEPGTRLTVPSGSRTYAEGRKVVPGSYHPVAADPLPWHRFLTALPKGMEKAADIIFFVFLVGGVIGVVKGTGAIDALIGEAIRRLGSRPTWLVGGMIGLFALGSATVGMAEEYMPFVPILVAMCLALKMDAMVAMGIVYVGAGVGYGTAALNPFTVLIAKDIAGQDPSVFFWPRWGLLALCVAIGTHHVLAYGARVRADPTSSLVADVDRSDGAFDMPDDTELTPARAVVLALFVAMIALFVWGVSAHGWYLTELAALFLALGLLAAAIGRLHPNEVARRFTHGAAELTGTALLIGFARTIEVIWVEGEVIDTVIHGIATGLQAADGLGSLAPVAGAWGMLVVQSVCNVLIPSGSGQAYVTMPIMAPLADLVGVGRETAVLAYQFGDGFTNMVVPTNALLMGMLGLARVPYLAWLRFILPLLAKIYVVALVVLAWAALVQLQ